MQNKLKNFLNLYSTILIVLLVLFLPLSSWAVSYFGNPNISLIRDLIVLLLFPLFFVAKNHKKAFWLALLFIAFGLLSYFWRQASLLQWLRGFRFTFIPLALFVFLTTNSFTARQKKVIYGAILTSFFFVALILVLQYFGYQIPLTSTQSGGYGMEESQFVQGGIARIQATLAGPNALGLYLLAIAAFAVGTFSDLFKRSYYFLVPIFALLFLTYSRSALVGFFILLVTWLFVVLREKIGLRKTLVLSLAFVTLIACVSLSLYKNPKYQGFLTHGESSSMRVEQYQRIWDTKFDIGLLGRGAGTAGPSSQNRLDGGENHYTENIYLDIFEEYGLIGLLLYLSLIIYLAVFSWYKKDSNLGLTVFLINISFAVSGLFINYYTGQVGIYLLWLANGLLVVQMPKTEKNNSQES